MAAALNEAKRNDHAKHGTGGLLVCCLVLESYGCLGREADQLLKDAVDEAASTGAVCMHGIPALS
jgi:hypothetical protein